MQTAPKPWRRRCATLIDSIEKFDRSHLEAVDNIVVLLCRTVCRSSSGIATIRPNAVVFIATEILADNRSAFSAGFADATAVNALIRPMIVPSKPSNVAILANVAR